MKKLLKISETIDRLSNKTGLLVRWLVLFMIVVATFNALARYVSRFIGVNLASNALLEIQWYAFSVIFLLGAAYGLYHNAHVRVDVIYHRLPERTRARVNLWGSLFLLIPFCLVMIWVSVPSVINSWSVLEGSPDPGGLPRYPIKTLVPLAFILLLLQGISEAIKSAAVLRGMMAFKEDKPVMEESV